MKEIIAKIALFGAIFFCWLPARAQDIDSIIEQMVEDGASEEQVEDYLQQRAVPVDLNAASRRALEDCGLFTPFQIAGLLEYRTDYGALLSLQELQMIDGFSREFVERIAPMVTLGGGTAGSGALHLEARSRYKYKGGVDGIHQYNRVLAERGRWKAGLLAESDAGEIPLVDHLGGYLGYSHVGWSLLAGDYSACFGQGLVVWNAFSFTGASSPASVLRRPRGIVPYKSADENLGFRGLAASRELGGRWCLTAFASAAGVDAKVTEDGYTSLPATGYHRTIYEKGCKNAMREYITGANATFRAGLVQAGVTAVAYTYSQPNARKVMPYNHLQMYSGWMGNISADFLLSAGHWRFFGEAAMSANFKPAAVAGAVLSASYDFEASALLRYYDMAYIAPHAGAYSTISSVSNQAGAVLSLLWRPVRGLLLTSFTEAVYYPGIRYRIDTPSSAVYEKLRAEWTVRAWTVSLQDNFSWQSYSGQRRHSLKAAVKMEAGSWKASLRAGAAVLAEGGASRSVGAVSQGDTSAGWALAASASRTFAGGRVSAQLSAVWYDAPTYDTRVYLFESDLPGNFSLQYYYGKGIAARGLVKLKMGRRLSLSLLAAMVQTPECRVQADFKF